MKDVDLKTLSLDVYIFSSLVSQAYSCFKHFILLPNLGANAKPVLSCFLFFSGRLHCRITCIPRTSTSSPNNTALNVQYPSSFQPQAFTLEAKTQNQILFSDNVPVCVAPLSCTHTLHVTRVQKGARLILNSLYNSATESHNCILNPS